MGCNSNSFTHGLLIAANINIIQEPSLIVPGWSKPVPKIYFGV